MERYKLIKELGEGAFGSVTQAINKHSGEVVAIKQMKRDFDSWQECLKLREVKSLQNLKHPNIVKLKELVRESRILYFVFECMEQNLYEVIKHRKNLFSEAEVKRLCFQVFQGLAYMHEKGYFHRDLKPENLLITKDTVKIADFGLAREIDSEPPYTQYVSTRWYRAPEVILRSDSYGSKVDMWAMGAIMAELFNLRPLFPGNGEADQLCRICRVLGSPTIDSWTGGVQLARTINYQFPKFDGVHLSTLMPSAGEDAINLISMLCSWNPCNRPTAEEALKHPFFRSSLYIPPPLRFKAEAEGAILSPRTGGETEQKWDRRYHGALPDPSSNNNYPSSMAREMHNHPSTVVHCTFDRVYQDLPIDPKQMEFGPHSIHMGRTNMSGVVSGTASITTGPWRRQFVKQPRPLPFEADGGVQGITDSGSIFIKQTQQFHPARIYARKVAV